MNEVDAFIFHDADETVSVLMQYDRGFGAGRHAEELAAQSCQLVFHPPAFARDQGASAFGFQSFDDFERCALRATGIQLRYDLQDSEAGLNQRR